MSLVVRIPLLIAGTKFVLECSGAPPAPENTKASCSAKFNVTGSHGSALHLIPTGWKNENGYTDVLVQGSALLPQMGGRAYFADSCTAGKYNNTDYMRANLLGKTMRFSTHLDGAGCGCNAAFYLTSMGHNKEVSECFDHYCDANHVCGQTCAEIDIMEANQHAWHSTLHTAADSDGSASGFGGGGNGWNGPRDWSEAEYGIGGSCIDTAKPFDVAVSFPLDEHGTLVSMEVTLSQKGHDCKLQATVEDYAGGFNELTHALLDGMTPIISYWADDDMLWMDGKGADGRGPCWEDSAAKCADSVKLFDFSIEDLGGQGPEHHEKVESPMTPRVSDKTKASCSAKFNVSGNHGSALHLIPTGWKNKNGYADVLVEGSALLPQMGGRAYFADSCTAGKYNNTDYMRANLLGKTMRFSTHLDGAGCGCNAAFYLTSMGHNKEVSECFDHYCDANHVCGQTCAEIDIMEANQHAWHSTLHTAADSDGSASGFGGGGNGWNGPRDWSEAEYGIGGSCIDTAKPFDVAVSFPLDEHGTLVSMEVTLSQKGHDCKLQAKVDDYASGFKELTHALLDGMTPIISYWADDDMLWMDGKGADGRGPCWDDSAAKCAESVKLFDFSIEDLGGQGHNHVGSAAGEHDKHAAVKSQSGEDSSQESDASWWYSSEQSMGTDQWNENEQAEDILVQKDDITTGALRGAMDSGRLRLRGFIWVSVVAVGLVMLVSVTLVLRRAPRPMVAADDAGDGPAEAAGRDNRPAVVRRDSLSCLRTAFSKGSFGQLDSLGGSTPTPMLQQPPSNQNLLAFGGV